LNYGAKGSAKLLEKDRNFWIV